MRKVAVDDQVTEGQIVPFLTILGGMSERLGHNGGVTGALRPPIDHGGRSRVSILTPWVRTHHSPFEEIA